MIEIIKNPKIDFIGKRYIAFVMSACLIAIGIIGFIKLINGNANTGIEFSGGSIISIKFKSSPSVKKIREILRKNALSDKNVQEISNENKVIIKLKKGDIPIGKAATVIKTIFTKEIKNNNFEIERNEEVGPAVGRNLQSQAIKATIFALIGILVYIWWRFEFKFSVAATIATFHDVMAVLGICILTNKEFSLLIVTALLTIAGYSLTDTVVLFDRIRMNLKTRSKSETYNKCINRSINEVLSRTIMTSLTTLLVVLSIMILGGEVIYNFAFALFIGIIVGTYSSIFVASPIVVEWEHRKEA